MLEGSYQVTLGTRAQVINSNIIFMKISAYFSEGVEVGGEGKLNAGHE